MRTQTEKLKSRIDFYQDLADAAEAMLEVEKMNLYYSYITQAKQELEELEK